MARTLEQQLDDVDAAIAKIEQGNQSYMAGAEGFTRARLDTLYKRRDQLQALMRRESRGGAASVLDMSAVGESDE